MNVLSLSRAILKRVASLGGAQVTPEDLKSIRGLGEVKRLQVVAMLALGKRLEARNGQEILSTKDVWNMCNDLYSSFKEHFVAFYLDTQSRLIERKLISVGTLDVNIVHPRDVFEPALTLACRFCTSCTQSSFRYHKNIRCRYFAYQKATRCGKFARYFIGGPYNSLKNRMYQYEARRFNMMLIYSDIKHIL